MEALTSPGPSAARAFLSEHLPALGLNHRCLLVVGRCRVDYDGRASSEAGLADRVVLCKSDGSLLVHDAAGFKPINWQPPGCTFGEEPTEGGVVLVAHRAKPAETVRITFESIQLLAAPRLDRKGGFDLRGSEFDLRDFLRARPELVDPGFRPWERERMTERGPLDLYGEDAQGRRVVVEVKRIRAGLAEATQLWRYVEKERKKRDVEVRGILVAPAISVRARALLRDHGLEFRAVSWDQVKVEAERVLRRAQPTLMSYASSPRQTIKG